MTVYLPFIVSALFAIASDVGGANSDQTAGFFAWLFLFVGTIRLIVRVAPKFVRWMDGLEDYIRGRN